VRAALELQERRVQKKEQEKADKQMKAEEWALAKIQKQQEAQKKRDDRAAAKAAREAAKVLKKAQTAADRETKKARRQAEIEAKIASSRPRVKPNKKQVPLKPVVIEDSPRAQNALNQSVSRSGRIVRLPARLSERNFIA
jgi:regulator of protease activity HflC (stomatin/prohibitin superfamily)